MIAFAAPWLLATLALLPALAWLLRLSPPPPQDVSFPAIRLLIGLVAPRQTATRMPWWLLALRLSIAALVIIGLAGPSALPRSEPAGAAPGPLLVVVDDGWAAAPLWPRLIAAADAALARASREGRTTTLLTTAPTETGTAPTLGPDLPANDNRARLAALRPKPWPSDRAAAAAALATRPGHFALTTYVADGLTDGPDWPAFAHALTAASAGPLNHAGPAQGESGSEGGSGSGDAALLIRPPRAEPDRLIARVSALPSSVPRRVAVRAITDDGRALTETTIPLAPGATSGEAAILLPAALRNRLTRLSLGGAPSAGTSALLDERWRRRPVGLIGVGTAEGENEAPLTGALYYVRRALAPYAELRQGDLSTLLSQPVAVLIDTDQADRDVQALQRWVNGGGTLIRFAGPNLAAETDAGLPDPLLPVRLLPGERRLGGALSWSEPAALAPFPANSPFAGLAVAPDVRVSRQVLADPASLAETETWLRLTDGTPLITAARRGAGTLVLVHVTANADWSNLPLSGLFVDLLRRLIARAAGVAPVVDATPLAPTELLDGFGALQPPTPYPDPLRADAAANAPVTPRHPPGFYGPENARRALNLGAALPDPQAAPPIAGAIDVPLAGQTRERELGPPMLLLALLLLLVDGLVALALRGLLTRRRPATAPPAVVALTVVALALAAASTARANDVMQAALAPRLAAIVTNDPHADAIALAGLIGLSDYVNHHTATVLAHPDTVVPGTDDLSVYPLLYWPITASAGPLSAAAAAALTNFTARGGILLIDTEGAPAGADGSGAGFAPDATTALRRATAGLTVPALAPLGGDHVLTRAFYLLSDFPGRFDGATVWVQRDQDRANDSVSPVVIGGNDWAAAWAIDAAGANPYATLPGGARQRILAYRFGVNLVMYALTGNYKGDQVHVPAILERLGQ